MPRRKECPGGWGTPPARSSRRQRRQRALAACGLAPRSRAGAAPGHPAAAPALADAPRRGGWRTGGSVCTGRDSHQETCTDQWENQFTYGYFTLGEVSIYAALGISFHFRSVKKAVQCCNTQTQIKQTSGNSWGYLLLPASHCK